MKRSSVVRRAMLLIVIFYVFFSLFNYSSIEEDAFIVYKYAENIVDGYGQVFNRGGERIEACSTLTWLYLLTLFHALGFNLPTASKLLGIFFGCISLLLIFRITRCFTDKMPWVVFPALLTSLSVPFLMWNQMGLETSIYTVIFLSLLSVCLDKSLVVYWPLVALVLIITRPEGFFMLLGLIPVFYLYRERRKILLYSLPLFLLLVIAMELLRFFYFYDFFPSAFYIKVYPTKYLLGFRYMHLFFRDYYLYLFCIPLLYLIVKRWNWEEKRSIMFGFMVVYCVWVIYAGEEGSKPYYRPLVPFIPVFYIYFITGIERACDSLSSRKQLLVESCIVVFALTTLFFSKNYLLYYYDTGNPVAYNVKQFVSSPSRYSKQTIDKIRDPSQSGQVLVGNFIQRNYFPGTTLVYDQLGRVPYGAGSEYFFIDSWGLIDKAIGRYHFYQKSKDSTLQKWYEQLSSFCIKRFDPDREFLYTREDVLDYIFRKNPDVILIYEFILAAKDRFPYLLTMDQRFKDYYRLQYFMDGTLFFEKKGLHKKLLDIPDGLSVISAEEYFAQREDRQFF